MKNTPRSFVWWIVALAFLICINALAARAQSGVDMGCSPTVANPCGGSTPSNNTRARSRSSSSEDNDADRTARNAIIDRYNEKIGESNAAVKAGNYREAARLLREAIHDHEALGENKFSREARTRLRDYENYTEASDAAKAGNAAVAAGDYGQALKYYATMMRNPSFNTKQNKDFIADLTARVQKQQAQEAQEERNRIEREAGDIKIATRMREAINDFASSLDTEPPSAGLLVTQGGSRGNANGFGTYKADAPLRFGDPDAVENLSEQGRQGFDDPRRLKGSEPVRTDIAPSVTGSEVAPVSIPEKFSKDPQIVEFQNQWKAANFEKATAEKDLAELRELRKKPEANKEELDVKEVDIRLSMDTAKSKQAAAVSNIAETVRVLTFKEQKVN